MQFVSILLYVKMLVIGCWAPKFVAGNRNCNEHAAARFKAVQVLNNN